MEAETSTPVETHSAAPVISLAPDSLRKNPAFDFLQSLLVTVLLALFGTTFIVQAFKIPSQSMEPTLLVGDHLLVSKFVIFEERYGRLVRKALPYRAIRRGDVVVFKFPYDDHPHYVKRVISLPGDRIRIVNQQVYVNAVHLSEPYVIHDPSGGRSHRRRIFHPPTVALSRDRSSSGMGGADHAARSPRRTHRSAKSILRDGR